MFYLELRIGVNVNLAKMSFQCRSTQFFLSLDVCTLNFKTRTKASKTTYQSWYVKSDQRKKT